jgi:hypothetical protein
MIKITNELNMSTKKAFKEEIMDEHIEIPMENL